MQILRSESFKISYASLRVWGKTIGIDEHSFVRNKKYGHKEFTSIFADYNKSRVREIAYGNDPEKDMSEIPEAQLTQDLEGSYFTVQDIRYKSPEVQ